MITKNPMTPTERAVRHRLIDLNLKISDIARHFNWSSQYTLDLIKGKSSGPAAKTNLQKIFKYIEI